MKKVYGTGMSRFISTAVIFVLLIGVGMGAFAESLQVSSTSSTVLVNGQEIAFEAYMINNSNYFKLRDLAKVVSGTDKQFEVRWNSDKKAIELISNEAYTEVGNELALGDGSAKIAKLNTSIVYKDGEEVNLEVYTINENNYFKLRDIAQAFNIAITWDGETKAVGIDTTAGYVVEEAQTEETEIWIESMSFIDNNKILVKFDQPIPTNKAGETYAALVYEDWDGMAPWESGMYINLVEGESEIIIYEYESYEMPGAGKYTLYIEGFNNVRESNLVIE